MSIGLACDVPYGTHPYSCSHSSDSMYFLDSRDSMNWKNENYLYLFLISDSIFIFRSSFTVLANILVYVATFVSLKLGEDTDPSDQIGPQDEKNFERVVYFGLSVGMITSLTFHVGVNERKAPRLDARYRTSHKSVSEFMRDPQMYQVFFIYLFIVLFCNVWMQFSYLICLFLSWSFGQKMAIFYCYEF